MHAAQKEAKETQDKIQILQARINVLARKEQQSKKRLSSLSMRGDSHSDLP